MKKQIRRISLHQNAKVYAILLAVTSLMFIVPMLITRSFGLPVVNNNSNAAQAHFPKIVFIIMPFAYLVFGYIGTIIGCAIYNYFFKFIGGFEFEVDDIPSRHETYVETKN